MISCLLVEDQTLVRLGLANLLSLEPGISVDAMAQDGIEALSIMDTQTFDVVLLDMRMPNLDGIGVLEAMRQKPAPPPVLIITTFEDCDVLVKAINLGAKGYVMKNCELETLIDAIKKVKAGIRVLQNSLTEYLLQQQGYPTEKLTPKELEVLKCMSLGMPNKVIANTLKNSEGTIRNHVSQILAKLEVNDRTQAVIKAINQNLI
ncbi:DNA-binding response regulator [Pseudoalteromonas phenolica]|uniref:response regulator n=1 Tax=Pseudoalteromonas phenolica TaxID=161398 RepID=UPI00110B609C|nr:response regulator transcription factor [Pseudoalteromonas phenolica]TMN92923.1 DNA-binding response regulator [Pseudoalteromonas phenolica]